MRLGDIADTIGGSIAGSAEAQDIEIIGVSGILSAREGDITFLSSGKMLKALLKSKASAVIVREVLAETDKPQVLVRNPLYAFAQLLALFHPPAHPCSGLSPQASVSPAARLGSGVTVGAFSYIADDVSIGDGTVIYPGVFIGTGSAVGDSCVIYPNVTVREGVTIGHRVIIHAGAVIGADGFGFVFDGGKHNKIPQVGGVVIGDDVEIGANTTVDRATTGNTVIGSGTKIDNLVQVGHNVQVGRNVILVAQIGIGGSTEIGDGVMMGGQSAVAEHSVIEPGAMLAARSGIMGIVRKGVYAGTPIMPHRDWLKASAAFAKLPDLVKKVRELENKLQSLRDSEQQ
ncbi:MAG TPA: UDP-3-O-(3-hydroxymyristoyl)glucosamine N-acyltransferase [Dissulfurispiraceae bacterium]|nr:UDP-3-O-(3-hydroxymyristoyl)glucosamine N-acyltransferase [Dissulfurispiraceae bacterium]